MRESGGVPIEIIGMTKSVRWQKASVPIKRIGMIKSINCHVATLLAMTRRDRGEEWIT